MFTKTIYIAGALTGLNPQERTVLKQLYIDLAEACKTSGFEPFVPHLMDDPDEAPVMTPQELDQAVRDVVTKSCLVIMYAGKGSTGAGIEIEMAYHANTPVVLLYETEKLKNNMISRIVRGNPTITQEISFSDPDDAHTQLSKFLVSFEKSRTK